MQEEQELPQPVLPEPQPLPSRPPALQQEQPRVLPPVPLALRPDEGTQPLLQPGGSRSREPCRSELEAVEWEQSSAAPELPEVPPQQALPGQESEEEEAQQPEPQPEASPPPVADGRPVEQP